MYMTPSTLSLRCEEEMKQDIISPYSNITSFFRFVNKRASYPFGIISLAHAPVNVTDFSIGSIFAT